MELGENPKEANMNTGKAIFLGLALVALAIFARDVMPSATASSGEVGKYAVAGVSKNLYFY